MGAGYGDGAGGGGGGAGAAAGLGKELAPPPKPDPPDSPPSAPPAGMLLAGSDDAEVDGAEDGLDDDGPFTSVAGFSVSGIAVWRPASGADIQITSYIMPKSFGSNG